MYHRFAEDSPGLSEQCEYIRRYYEPVSLRSVSNWLKTGESLPPNAIAITVDDGYRDFLLRGYPVFQKFGLPTTVYAVTDFLDGNLWPWWNQIEYAFSHTKLRTFMLDASLGGPKQFSLDSMEQKVSAGKAVAIELTHLPNKARLRFLSDLSYAMQVQIPKDPPETLRPLSWNEVRELARNGVEFGAHTKTHPILARIRNPSELREEIEGSKLRLEEMLDKPCVHFCYPNGSFEDFTDSIVELVGQSGFDTAVTTERGLNFGGADPFRLRRIAVEPFGATYYFRELLAGVREQ
jgi:peptidoglycan/xylan/chitin deacetylase (PgdA/CDA1 family)